MDYILSATLARLDELMSQEVKVLSGIENHVKILEAQLVSLKDLLKQCDARKFPELDGLFLDLTSIIDAAHEVEDVVESYALKSTEPVAVGRAINFIKRLAFSEEQEATIKFDAIIRRFSYILATRTVDVLINFSRDSEMVGEDLRYEVEQSQPPLIRHTIIGIDEKVEQVVESLLDVTKSPFVAICDRPGAGKTTLAKKVYNHTKVRCNFDYFAWVYIYDNPFTSEMGYLVSHGVDSFYNHLFLEILHKLKDDEINLEMVAEGRVEKEPVACIVKLKLDEILRGKKCLVVLDDKFDPCGALEGLPSHFPHPLTGSKFLLISGTHLMTSREIIVHELPGFNSEDAWQLLQSVTGSVTDYDMQLETLGRNIAKHLNGWPWAIMVTAGVLAAKPCPIEWQKVYDSIVSFSDESGPLHSLFMLSYINLPAGLKPLLFYLSRFPEGHEIRVSRLVRLWIAEGLVSSRVPETAEKGETLEDLAERNLNELMSRGLVLVGDRDASLRVTTCHLHETVRNLCLIKVKLSFLNYQTGSTECDFAIHQHTHSYQFPNSGEAEERSFLFFQRYFGRFSMPCTNFHKNRLLRVLDLESAFFLGEENPPRSIFDLIHLRYLSLRNVRFSKIPSTLGNLRFLQTLDLLNELGESVYIPDVIWKLNRLRHLFLPKVCDTKVKLRLDTLTNLRTLVNFSARNCDLKDLFVMTKLRELSIRDAMSIRNFARFSKLLGMKLKHLQTFSIYDSSKEGGEEYNIDKRILLWCKLLIAGKV